MNRSRALGLLPVLLSLAGAPALSQSASPTAPPTDPTQLEDVVVSGRPLEARAEAFVASVGAPVEGRKLATWSGPLCVGAAGLEAAPARAMVVRVLDWAHSLRVRIGAPGCDPNVLIVFSADADQAARDLVKARPLDFDPDSGSSHQGRRALRVFQNSGRPVRWWHVSLPVNPDTGDALVRVRGQSPFSAPSQITRPGDLGNYGQITLGSRLYDDSLDALQSIVIVIDDAALEQTSFSQLSDYVAMVALAQVDSNTRPSAPSILGIFERGAAHETTLSEWDQAFLQALYGTHQRNSRPHADGTIIARSLARRLEETAVEP